MAVTRVPMSWLRILVALTLPMVVAMAVAALFWRRRQWTLGTVIGAGVLLSGGLVFGGLEYVDGLRFRLWCEQTGTPCMPSHPSDFVRISAYGIVAMLQVMMLFVAAGWLESRWKRTHYDAQWQ